MTKVLICGDSFAADWFSKYNEYPGWPNLLDQQYNVTNLAQAGCSEYKIFKQLQSQDLTQYQYIIVVHTSPFRIPVEVHPVHHNDVLHKNSDFLYLDIKKSNKASIQCIIDYYEKFHWQEHALFVHKCTLLEELKLLQDLPCLHLTMIPWDNLVDLDNFINLNSVFTQHQGLINHLTKKGNEIVFQQVLEYLK